MAPGLHIRGTCVLYNTESEQHEGKTRPDVSIASSNASSRLSVWSLVFLSLSRAWKHRSVEAGSNTSGKSRAATSRDRALTTCPPRPWVHADVYARNLVPAGCQSRQCRGTMRNVVCPSCPWHAVATPRVRHARARTLFVKLLPAVAAATPKSVLILSNFSTSHDRSNLLVSRDTPEIEALRARRLLVDSDNVMCGMHVRNVRRSNLSASSAARVSLRYVAWAVYQLGPRWRRLLPARWKTLREAGIRTASSSVL